MAGTWVLIVEFLIAVIFLARSRIVRQGVRRIRKTVGLGLICLTLLLSPLAEWVYSKGSSPTRSPSQSQTLVLPVPSSSGLISSTNSSFILQRSALSSGLPAWWNDDDTDSDDDGIPDLWEKWTHGNRYVEDSTIDRDDDGLTDLEELQNQTDPRTADTDGDGFNDSFEVANGMNPVSAEDFTPTEPDADHNGRIDLWENAPYYYGFTDNDHDGFDDYYECEVLESESDENFDVIVKIYTTRSAVLTWDGGANGIVVLPTTGQAVRLRLPFGVDSTLNLLPSPEGTDPPSGELWKSRMRLAFSPRSGQRLQGNALVSPDGMIAHKVVNQERSIELFAPPSTVGFQTLSLWGEGAGDPSTEIKAGWFQVNFDDRYHDLSDGVGAFTVTNHFGMGDAIYDWSSAFGDMEPESGTESWLTVTRLPEYDGKMTVVTATELDSETRVAVTSIVEKCCQRVFTASFSTNNFSPQLGETLGVGVTLPECEHVQIPGWLKIEVVRETIGGTQHVASVDMEPGTPSVDRYLDTSTLGGQTLVFAWDGRAQVTLPLADHPDLFTQGHTPFHRAMPEIRDGDPVPPPFYTVAVRLWNSGKTEVLDEFSQKVFIPQVVSLFWQPEALAAFRTPMVHRFPDGDSTVVYPGYYGDTQILFPKLLEQANKFMPEDVNLRLVIALMEEPCLRSYYVKRVLVKPDEVVRVDAKKQENMVLGETGAIPRNERTGLMIDCYAGSFLGSWRNTYENFAKGLSKSQVLQYQEMFCITNAPNTLILAMGHTIAHETGHSLGLVHGSYLVDGEGYHNPEEDENLMMNRTTKSFQRLWDTPTTWKELNLNYLKFILPTH